MKQHTPEVMDQGQVNQRFLQEFEMGFDPVYPDRSSIPVTVLGYGEISTVIAFDLPEYRDHAFKRLPLFSSEKEAVEYCALYLEYNSRLNTVGIATPPSDAYAVKGHHGLYVAYLGQKRLPGKSIANKPLLNCNGKEINILFRLVVEQMIKIWRYNQEHPEMLLGLDSQISNWAVRDFTAESRINEQTRLYFIDTSTPFIRKDGMEQMNARLFLQSAPKPLRGILKKFFLQDIMDRYYNFRLTATDLAANLFKEQCPQRIPALLDIINHTGAEFLGEQKITYSEVERYYRDDRFIWKLFLGVRRADRFFRTKVCGKRYEFTLPGKIRR